MSATRTTSGSSSPTGQTRTARAASYGWAVSCALSAVGRWYLTPLYRLMCVTTLKTRRRLGGMALAASPKPAAPAELGKLRGEIMNAGSSWAALMFALETRPLDLCDLLKTVGVNDVTGVRRDRAFDACADGYTVYHDARLRDKL